MRKSFFKKLKYTTAALLAAAMVVGGLQGVGSEIGVAYAAKNDPNYQTELEPNVPLMDGRPYTSLTRKHYYDPSTKRLAKAASYGNGSTTAYKYGYITVGASGFNGWKFDINGLTKAINTEPANENEEAYVISDSAGALSSTFPTSNPQGYTNALFCGPTAPSGTTGMIDLGKNEKLRSTYVGETTTPPQTEANFYPGKDGEIRNGEVVKAYDSTNNNADLKLEVRLSVKPSPDKKYILAEYTVYNANDNADDTNGKIVDPLRRASAGGDGGRTVWFASGTDIMVAGDDRAPAWATKKGEHDGQHIEGIHAQGNNGDKYRLGALDILTYHPQLNLGIQPLRIGDTSKVTTWIGYYGDYSSNYASDLENISYMPGGTQGALDSGIAYSFKFDLLPGETKTGTIAFSMRGPTYYVDPVNGSDSTGTGFLSSPYKSTAKALEVIGGNNKPEKNFVFLMNDEEIDKTIKIPAGRDITIQTTDYVMDSSMNAKTKPFPIIVGSDGERTNSKTIKRKAGFTGNMFEVTHNNSNVTFGDIVIDGNKTATAALPKDQQPRGSLVKATAGNVLTQTGAIFKDNKIIPDGEPYTDSNGNGQYDSGEPYTDLNNNSAYDGENTKVASAIDISGSANLKMDYGTIKDNESYQGGAVNVAGSGNITVANNVNINSNKNDAGGNSNVRLGTGKTVLVGEKLPTGSRIGITTEEALTTSNIGIGLKVAEKTGQHTSLPYSANNFPADNSPGQWTEFGAGNESDNVYLKATQAAYSVSYVYKNDVTGVETSLSNPVNVNKVAGDAIEQTPVTVADYIFKKVEITPDNHGLSVDANTGKVVGSMPGVDVSVKYIYERNVGIAYFNSNGGTPNTIAPIESAAGGAPSASMPTVSRTGYTFGGWRKVTGFDASGNPDYTQYENTPTTALPNPVAQGKLYFIAKWDVDPTPYLYEITHKNTNTLIPLVFKQDSNATNYKYLDETRADKITIPGYVMTAYNADPSNKGVFGQTYTDSEGTITPTTTTEYVGRMPLGPLKVNYMYRVDPSQDFLFTVEHKTPSGTDVGTAIPPVRRRAEAPISAEPRNIPGYRLRDVAVTVGKTANMAAYIVGLDEMAGGNSNNFFDSDRKFNGYMPNQAVTIRYTYDADGYAVTRNYIDTTNNRAIGTPVSIGGYQDNQALTAQDTGGVLSAPATRYGYLYSGTSDIDPVGSPVTVAGNGSITGTVASSDILVNHKMNRDANYWKHMNFAVGNAPYNKGSISTVAPIQFLIDDPSTTNVEDGAHTFKFIQDNNTLPTPTAQDTPYYRFEGWYTDAGCTNKVLDNTTFKGDVTLYAKFDKDPAYWVDINFDSDDKGSITGNTALNVRRDATWASIAAERATPVESVPNYVFDKWTINGATVEDGTVLIGGTYHANFKKNPVIWGLRIGDFNASGHINSSGKGQIRVRETQPGNVYIITDANDNVVAVRTAPDGNLLTFDGLYPGTKYFVREAAPGTTAAIGQPAPSGNGISIPKEVKIPTLEDNYNVGFDPVNEDRSQIVVNPADPDSDYAILDEDGNVVNYPGSDNGWKTPVGKNPSTVTFDNLDPSKTYTVVARKKGDTSVTAASKKDLGTSVSANPGDTLEAAKYIVEVKPGDNNIVKILSVGGKTPSEHINSTDLKVTDAKAEDEVSVHAESVDSNGKAFKHWVVIAGRSKNISGKITTPDFTFKLSGSNVVLRAVYEKSRPNAHSGNAANAIVDEEIRGGASGEYSLDPDGIEGVESRLTTPEDRVLIGQDADVRYRVVFNKRTATAAETADVKAVSVSGIDHPEAFTTAWGLDIKAERYVDGRFTGNIIPAPASPSNATVPVLVQLPAEDSDMMDYQLFDVTDAATLAAGAIDNFAADVSNNPENTAGYFAFSGEIGHKYVLVYSKAFRLKFIDNNQSLYYLDLNNTNNNFYHTFKVRKKDSVSQYASGPDGYGKVMDYVSNIMRTPFEDIYGVQYDYVAWSKRNMPEAIREFKDDSEVTSRLLLYAYYKDNRKAKDSAYSKLEDLKIHAQDVARSPYLKSDEVEDLQKAIARAAARLAQKRGEILDKSLFEAGASPEDPKRMANLRELQECIDELERLLSYYEDLISDRSNRFIRVTGGGSSGGSGSAGRGNGTAERPFELIGERTFSLGVDGNWKINEATGKWSFVLNGGLPLNNTWGKIQYADAATGKLLTKWYFFDNQSSMAQGWYHDERTDKWYLLNDSNGADGGQMITGWHKDAAGVWYYLDPVVGEMYLGWHQVGEHWYYFAPNATEGHPQGSLYVSTTTPDGYRVNHDGEWVQ